MKTIIISKFTLLFLIVLALCQTRNTIAQDSTASLTWGGYIDSYYSYDNDKNGNSVRKFSPISAYREEFRINIAQVSASYTSAKIRGTITLQYGDIPSVNWPANQQFIQQANAGFSPVKNLWLDAGYFLTHIGAEGLLPKDNFLTSQSLTTYFEPFFQSGVKISYDFSPKFTGCIHLLNGFNVFTDNNKNKSAGVTLDYKPSGKSEIIFNNIVGNEQPSGSPSKVRTYNNLVFKLALSKKLDFIAGVDFATQEKSKITDSTASAMLYSGLASIKYKMSKKFAVALRGEVYNDEDGMLSGIFLNSDGEATGLKTYGITLGLEYKPVDNSYVRIEGRYLSADSKQKIFLDNSNSRIESTVNIGVWF